MVMPLRLVLALIAAGAVGTVTAADWPQLRGPNGTGRADGKLPGKADLLWKVAMPGKGNGAPIIVGDNIFHQSAAADGSKRTLVCLNATDGKERWATSHDAEAVISHTKAGMAANTPAADGTAIYCVWWDGPTISLRAYDSKTGKEQWSAPLGKQVSQHGAHYSPTTHLGLVFVNVDQDGTAELVAFDTKTGKKVWSTERPARRASYTTPILLERAGKAAELIVGSTTGIDSYEPKTGKVNWHYTIPWAKGKMPLRMIGAPQFTDGLLVVNSGEGSGSRYAFAFSPDGTGDISATAPAWKATKDTPYIPGIVSGGEHLFWVTDTGIAVCAETKTGVGIWNERVFAENVCASLLLLSDGVLAVSEKGRVATWKAGNKFDLIEEWSLGEVVIASPAAANGRVFIRGAAHLFCYGKK